MFDQNNFDEAEEFILKNKDLFSIQLNLQKCDNIELESYADLLKNGLTIVKLCLNFWNNKSNHSTIYSLFQI